jgi:tetratricopeptide (TPR) repeat protein
VISPLSRSGAQALVFFAAWCCAVLPAAGHGDLHEQIEQVTRRIATGPTAALHLRRGELYREHEEYEKALADYRTASELDPSLAEVELGRGKALLAAGRPGDARLALDRFLAAKPGHAAGLEVRGRALAAAGRTREAIADFDQALARAEEPVPETFIERSMLQRAAGDSRAALEGLDEGIRRLGPILTLQSAAIEIELAEQRHDAALARVALLAGAAERKEGWHFQRGEILRAAGRPAEARQAFHEALTALEALPPRLRALAPTLELERKIRDAMANPGVD